MSNIVEENVLDFLNFGMCSPSSTFFSIPTCDFSESIRTFLADFSVKNIPLAETAKNIYSLLEIAVDEIVQTKSCDSFALSGGADSRLIFSLLIKNHKSFVNQIKVYTRVHPVLGQKKDRDYLIAEALCRNFNVRLVPETSVTHANHYLVPNQPSNKKCISGLWGGELLGAAFVDHQLFSLHELLKATTTSPLTSYALESIRAEALSDELEFAVFNYLLYESQMTAFYKSLSWFTPSDANNYTMTPFLNKDFQKALFNVPLSQIKNYKLYYKILENYCSKFLFVPINNFCLPTSSKAIFANNIGLEPKEHDSFLTKYYEIPQKLISLDQFVRKHNDKKYSHYLSSVLPYLWWI